MHVDNSGRVPREPWKWRDRAIGSVRDLGIIVGWEVVEALVMG